MVPTQQRTIHLCLLYSKILFSFKIENAAVKDEEEGDEGTNETIDKVKAGNGPTIVVLLCSI